MSIGFDADNIFILFITIPCIIICVKKIKFVKNECFATKGVCISYDGSAGVTKLLSYNGTYKYLIDGKEYVSSTKNYQEMKRPKKGKEITLYVDKKDYSHIEPEPNYKRYVHLMILEIIASFFFCFPYMVIKR